MKTSTKIPLSRFGSLRAVSFKYLVALLLLALPGLLSAQTLVHRYSFATDASDSVGGANGTLVAPSGGAAATITNGLLLPGGGVNNNGYVALPSGILTGTTNLTIEVWVTQTAATEWATIWCFDNNNNQNFQLTPNPGRNNGNLIVDNNPNNNETDLFSPVSLPNGSEQYVAVTFDVTNFTENLYYNGALDGTIVLPDASFTPGSYGGAGGTYENWLGKDTYNDNGFQGTIYELRIWNGLVSQRYLGASALVGAGVLVNNLVPTATSVTAVPSIVLTGTEQAAVSVQLPQTGANELAATLDATNWTSANTNILTVNSSGLISAVGYGSTTISATVAGVTGASAPITVVSPQLDHRYSFVSDASDSVGGPTWNGTLVAPNGGSPATITNGLFLPGNTVNGGGSGYSGYVSLPGGILTNTTSLTVECWVTQNQGNAWAELWDFGNNDNQNFGLIPYPLNNGNNMELAFEPNGGEQDLRSGVSFPNGSEQYVCLTYNNATLKGNLYANGALVVTTTFPNNSYAPGTYGAAGTTRNALGNDVFGDYQFSGAIYEFRIWNGALSPLYEEIAAVAGPGVVVTNLTPASISVTVTNTSMIGAQTQPATVVGNFANASGLTVTPFAINWISSNPGVLTVDSTGLITAKSGGNATVSATVNGVSATSATINVSDTAPVVLQGFGNPFVVVGDTVQISVVAIGGGLSYQWSFGSSQITGATNASLTLTNVAYTNGGTYNVLVSNNLGSTNTSGVLSVVPAVMNHRYSFASDATDSVGGPQWNGKLIPPTTGNAAFISGGLSLPGNQSGGYGYSGYLSLPSGILTNTTSLTVECWVTQNTANQWATVWDFGNDNNHNFEMCPFPQRGINNLDVAIDPNNDEVDTVTGSLFPSGSEQYVTYTFNAATLTGSIYVNGVMAATHTYPNATYIPSSIGAGAGGTTENMLGNDVYGDWQFSGTVYEFRIWNGAVTPTYVAVAEAAGPGAVVTNLTPTSVDVNVTNLTLEGEATEQAIVLGNFAGVSGATITDLATNWTSSNTNVLTVSTNGLIAAVGVGNATVSATFYGITGTSISINVPADAPTITVEPETAETLVVGATLHASVVNEGVGPFTYKWYYNSSPTPIAGATTSTLTIPNVQPGNAGNYVCVVGNSHGNVTSTALALTVISPTPYEANLLSLGPLAYWPLNETSGSVAYDLAGGYNGTYIGGVTLGEAGATNAFFGSPSYSVGFDGSSGYVDIPEGPFNITNAITVSAWCLPSSLALFGDMIGHGDQSWRITVNNTVQPGGNDGPQLPDATGPTAISDGNWHMVVYTYNGTVTGNNGILYVDGVQVAQNAITNLPTGEKLDVWIGGAPDYGTGSGKRLFLGNIASASVFSYALSAAQVNALYTGQVSLTIKPSGPNVIITWPSGTLLQATSLNGPWTTNNAAVSPYTTPATGASQFFRVVNP